MLVESTVAFAASHFMKLLESICAAPNTTLMQLPLLWPAEERKLLADLNQTTCKFEHRNDLVQQLVEAQVLAGSVTLCLWLCQALSVALSLFGSVTLRLCCSSALSFFGSGFVTRCWLLSVSLCFSYYFYICSGFAGSRLSLVALSHLAHVR